MGSRHIFCLLICIYAHHALSSNGKNRVSPEVRNIRSLLIPNDIQYLQRPAQEAAFNHTFHPAESTLSHPLSLHYAFFTLATSEFQSSSALAVEMASRGHKVSLGVADSRRKDIPPGVSFLTFGDLNIWIESIRNATLTAQTTPIDGPKDAAPLVGVVSTIAKKQISQKISEHMEEMAQQGTLPDVCVFTWLLDTLWHHCISRNIPVISQVPSVLTSPLLLPHANRPVEDVFRLDTPSRRLTTIRGRGLGDRLLGILVWTFVKVVVPHLTIYRFENLKSRPLTLRLVHSAPGFDFPAEHSPLTHYTGPLHSEEIFDPKHISADVLQFLSDSQSLGLPVVYVTFGTLIRLPEKRVHQIFEGLRSESGRRWRALWSHDFAAMNDTQIVDDTAHVKIVSWLAGPSVVAHDAVKIVISHCGSNGLHEALWQRKPILGIPVIGDQMPICDRLVASGAGQSLCHYLATSAAIKDSLVDMLDNYDLYSAAALRVSLLLRAMGGLKKAGDLLEIVGMFGHERMMQMLQAPSEFDGVFKAYFLDIATLLLVLAFVGGYLTSLQQPIRRILLSALTKVRLLLSALTKVRLLLSALTKRRDSSFKAIDNSAKRD